LPFKCNLQRYTSVGGVHRLKTVYLESSAWLQPLKLFQPLNLKKCDILVSKFAYWVKSWPLRLGGGHEKELLLPRIFACVRRYETLSVGACTS
jgi:hypothetical protein